MGEGLISVQFLFPFIFLSSHYPPLCLRLLPKGLSDIYSPVAGCLQCLESAAVVGMVRHFGHGVLKICVSGFLYPSGYSSDAAPHFLCCSLFCPIWNFFPCTSKSHHLVLFWIFSVALHSHNLWSCFLRARMAGVLLKPSGTLGFKLNLLTVSLSKDCGGQVGVH